MRKRNFKYIRFNLYWLVKANDWKDNWVFIAIRKDVLKKTIVKNQMDLISHLYYIVLDITKEEIHIKRQQKKIKIVNIYDNKLREEQI